MIDLAELINKRFSSYTKQIRELTPNRDEAIVTRLVFSCFHYTCIYLYLSKHHLNVEAIRQPPFFALDSGIRTGTRSQKTYSKAMKWTTE